MKRIRVKTSSKEYPVYIAEKIFSSLYSMMREHKLYQNVFVVVDQNVFSIHQEKIQAFLSEGFRKINLFLFDSSEKNKSSATVEKIYKALIKNHYGRDTVIVSIGGGITGDIIGFVASTFGRGIQFVQVPTTLLATVDSSVGGKTGINFGSTKNLIGSFYQPEFVLIDTEFLKTLPEDEIVCGIGEIVKTAFLIDQKFCDLLSHQMKNILALKPSIIGSIIESCVQFKANVVETDEKELGLRKILNLGHTFAHAIEVEQNHKIKHGQAVIIGTVCALYLSFYLGMINEKELEKFLSLPLTLKDKINLASCNVEEINKIMMRDKKNRDGKIKFVLLSAPGKIMIDIEAEKELVIKAIEDGVSLFI